MGRIHHICLNNNNPEKYFEKKKFMKVIMKKEKVPEENQNLTFKKSKKSEIEMEELNPEDRDFKFEINRHISIQSNYIQRSFIEDTNQIPNVYR